MQDRPVDTQARTPVVGSPTGTADLALQLNTAAVGPVNTAHYLAAFARLQAAGRDLPSWNWAAALFAPGWMVFRGLWRWCIEYLAVVLLLAGALVLVHRALDLPTAVLVGVVLASWLACAVLPGLWGDALVFRHVQQRIEAAVAAAPTMQQAIERLRSQAPTRRRLWFVAAGWVALLVAVGLALNLLVADTRSRVYPAHTEVPVQPIGTPPEDSVRIREMPPVASPSSVQEAQAPAAAVPAGTPTVQEKPLPSVPEPAVSESTLQSVPEKGDAPVQHTLEEVGDQPRPTGQANRPSRQDRRRATGKAGVRQLYINVGIFADPANAQRAHARLRAKGLPSTVDSITRADGTSLRRVRVGPFASTAQANKAAAQVRALGLEAVPAVLSADGSNEKE